MTDRPKYMIIDRTGVLWRSEGARGLKKGIAILDAVEAENKKGYLDALGTSWDGDLVLVQEIRRSPWVRRDPYA